MLNASFENFKSLSDGKDDNKWAQPPEPLAQSVGDQFSVVAIHIQSPNDIIVQKVENAGKYHFISVMQPKHVFTSVEMLICRSYPGSAAEAEATLLWGCAPTELQTCSWNSLLCHVLRYNYLKHHLTLKQLAFTFVLFYHTALST